ncbi:MAG TPA: lactonase family protein [Flavisolibacter sp.]|nr:lactonase family protein [Flavisolibacter sp.]
MIKQFLLSCIAVTGISLLSQAQYTLLVGTYTSGKNQGIYVYDFASNTGDALLRDSVKSSNPSFLAVAPNDRYVYAVNEDGSDKGGGKVSAYSFSESGKKLSFINQQPSMGDHPCYITVDRKNRWVVVGNYSSGNLSVLPIAPDGGVGSSVTNMQHQGQSINQNRQKAPHVHATVFSPDNKYLFVPDLGIDQIVVYGFNAKTGMIKPKKNHIKVTAGSGPRHLDFHPSGKWAYLAQELSGTVTVFKHEKGNLVEQQVISMLPADYSGAATSADIHVSPNGKFLYASNRNTSNTIAIFKINPADGSLELVGHQSTMGKAPRNFNFDPTGKLLLVANQETNNIVIFNVNSDTGLLTYSGKQIEVPNPVCIKWIAD